MSKSIQALRERRNALAKETNELMDQNKGEKWNATVRDQVDAKLAEIEAVDEQIARLEKIQAATVDNPSAEDLRNKHTKTPGAHGAESAALRAFLSGGVANLAEDDRNRMLARQTPDIRAAMSTTTPAEGGYTTSPEYYTQLAEAIALFGGMRAAASVIRTATGNTMNFPTANATAEEGEIVGQNSGAAAGDTTFGNATMPVFKYSSKKIALPWELLQDSFLDIEGYIRDLLAVRLGRVQNKHFTIGVGTTEPLGIVPAAASGKVGTTGQTATVIYEDLVDLEHSVDPLYRSMPGVGFMLHDQSLKVVRKIKDLEGRPIFVPGYEQGNPGGAPDRLLNRPIMINQHVPTMAANAKSILFGAFKKYLIRDVMDLTLFRMTDSAFTLLGQVGFVAFQRSGGNYIDGGSGVKFYQNSAT